MTHNKKSGWWRWLLLLLVVGAAAGGWKYYRSRAKDTTPDFKTTVLARSEITQAVTATGQINPVKNVQVGSQISGIIKETFVDFNSTVTNGQVIAQIDPSTHEQNVTQAEAELANAKAAEELAQLNHRRAKNLFDNGLITVQDHEKSLVELHQAEAVVRMREAALRKSKVDLERTTIYAPINGVVIVRNVDVGQTVAASFNTPTLFQIANDLAKMQIEAMVSEADVGGVEVGQKVTFSVDAFPTRQFEGQVKQVRYAPITNQNVVNYTTIVEVNNADLKLRPGMTANASIVTAQRRNALRLPNAALRFRPPEGVTVQGGAIALGAAGTSPHRSTNLLDQARTNEPAPSLAAFGEGGGRLSPEERRRRFENLSPEEREQMRARFRARFGDGPPPGAGGFGGGGLGAGGFGGGMGSGLARATQEGPVSRVVYVLAKGNPGGNGKPALKAVTVKLGITDGAFTEVLEGLKEGDTVVTGLNTPTTTAAAGPQAPGGRSPFGGPFGGFRPR
jgi:HlyD family secretion protein